MGKSFMVSNIGALLAKKNFTIGFIDADLGGANLHLCLGVKRPRHSLQDFLSGRQKDLMDITEKTIIPHSWLLSGASDIIELANPFFSHKQKLIRHLKKMAADFILVDLGAGTGNHITDFFTAFTNGVIISDGLPTSIENAYGFLKNGIIRGLIRLFPGRKDLHTIIKNFSDPHRENNFVTMAEMISHLSTRFPEESHRIKEWLAQRKTFLILNMVQNQNDISTGKRFIAIIKKYLNIHITYSGYIMYDPEIRRSIREMKPLMLNNPPQKSLECFTTVTENLLALL